MRSPRSERYCQSIVIRRAGNFQAALRLLPESKRTSLFALYSFARLADDIVDGSHMTMSLRDLSGRLEDCSKGPQPDGDDPWGALALTLRHHRAITPLLHELIEGMRRDEGPTGYDTWTDTEEYCYLAAGTVGLASLEVFGYTSPNAREHARNLGIALQLTNILRDLREDHQRGRQYLPQEDFNDFGITPEDLVKVKNPSQVSAFMRFQADRALTYYEKAKPLYRLVRKDSRFCPRALGLVYREYLELLRADPLSSLKGTLKIGRWRKASLVLQARFGRHG
ncbi:MAG: phytoene/squalene synthase family protein [Planctomycetota bacterium]